MAIAVPAVMKYIDEADNAKYMSQARGAFITAEAEVAKEYIKDKTTIADSTYTVTDKVSGKPEITKITADVDDKGNVTKVDVTFDDGKTATVNPNEEVIIK